MATELVVVETATLWSSEGDDLVARIDGDGASTRLRHVVERA